MNKKLAVLLILFIFIVITGYFTFNHLFLYTNHAYLDAKHVLIKPEVSGRIKKIYIIDLQHVQKGQKLLSINDDIYRQKVKLAKAKLETVKIQYSKLTDQLNTLKYTLKESRAKQSLLCSESSRYQALLRTQSTTKEKANEMYINCKSATNKILSTQKLIANLENIKKESITTYAPYNEAKANLAIAKINEDRTTIKATDSGYITAMTLAPGNFISVGEPLFTLIIDNTWSVTANVRESDLFGLKKGTKAYISLPSIPSKHFSGALLGIGWGVHNRQLSISDNTAVLPVIAKQLNWIQLDQRFPVKIKFTKLKKNYPFRVGATAHIFIVRNNAN